jgi:hypothetical protein
VGNSNGWIYCSDDNGGSFEPLPVGAILPPLTGGVTVAFDPGFGDNGTIYAASDSPGGGIYRFVVGDDTKWESIDNSLPLGGMVGALAVSTNGVLYAANFQQVDTGDGEGGVERCLESASGATFETVTHGLDGGATLVGLWLYGNQLWSIDTTNIRLMTYHDSLAQPVSLISPENQAQDIGAVVGDAIDGVRLDWETLDSATSYQWQLDDDDDFSSVPDGFEDTTSASSVGLSELEVDTTYYWRVRAIKPLLSPWSAEWSFTTSLDEELDAPQLESPQLGAIGVPVKPEFRWSDVDGAEGYELTVSSSPSFGECEISMVGDNALPGNVWQSDISLSYGTTYYWRVRAVSSGTSSDWSDIGVFTTEAEPEPTKSTGPTEDGEQTPTLTTTPAATTEPNLTTNTTLGPTAGPQTVVTTTTAALTSSPTPLSNQPASNTPDWLYYTVGSIGAVVSIVLAITLARITKRRY